MTWNLWPRPGPGRQAAENRQGRRAGSGTCTASTTRRLGGTRKFPVEPGWVNLKARELVPRHLLTRRSG